uniref:Uncharacterized protein n=1 Tax=Arundo donax TaxID=35708 RepID=A0A0A9EFU7_ARUDO
MNQTRPYLKSYHVLYNDICGSKPLDITLYQ